MKSHSFLRSALLSAGILSLGAPAAFSQAAAGGAAGGGAGGRGGAGNGTAGIARPMPPGGLPDEGQQLPPLSDLELTEITRIKLNVLSGPTKAVADARTELTKAVFALPVNAQSITAKIQALATAEQALAAGRADAFASAIKAYKELSPEKRRAIIQAIDRTAVATAGRGGG